MDKTGKTSLLNLVSSVIGIVVWVLLLVLAIIIQVKLGEEEYTYGTNFGLNWSQGPVEKIESENLASCPIGSTYGLVQTYFPGFKTGCYCAPNSYYSGYCGVIQNKTGCVQFPESTPKLLVSWGGSMCTDRPKQTTYFSLNTTNPNIPDSKCTDDQISCGVVDTLGGNLCINKDETCPINYLKVVNDNDSPNSEENVKNRGFAVTEVPFADGGKKFIFSNNNAKQGKVANQFLITDHKPCADSAENKIELIPNEKTYECKKSVGGYLYDPSWVLLDTMTIEQLVADNHLTTQLQPYPFWDSIKSRPVGLYYRGYIGLNSTCLEQAKDYIYPEPLNTIPQIFLNMKNTITTSNIDFISITTITIYVILLISLILKIILACNNNGRYAQRLYVNITGAFCCILLLIVAIVSTINISNARNQYIWFYNNPHCSDPINQGLLYLFDSYIREAYVIAVVFTIFVLVLFFIIILEYLLSHCYEEEERDEDGEAEDTSDSDTSKLLEKKNKDKESSKGKKKDKPAEIEMKEQSNKGSNKGKMEEKDKSSKGKSKGNKSEIDEKFENQDYDYKAPELKNNKDTGGFDF